MAEVTILHPGVALTPAGEAMAMAEARVIAAAEAVAKDANQTERGFTFDHPIGCGTGERLVRLAEAVAGMHDAKRAWEEENASGTRGATWTE